MVRIKYHVIENHKWGHLHATISTDYPEKTRFSPELFALFCSKIRRRYGNHDCEDYEYGCYINIDENTISCMNIPYSEEYFWIRVKYIISVINTLLWNSLITTRCDCGNIWTHWEKKCMNCATIHGTDLSEEPGVSESFNQLMEDAFQVPPHYLID